MFACCQTGAELDVTRQIFELCHLLSSSSCFSISLNWTANLRIHSCKSNFPTLDYDESIVKKKIHSVWKITGWKESNSAIFAILGSKQKI